MKMPKDDVLNALLTDLIADQVIRAMELGFKQKEVEDAARIGVSHRRLRIRGAQQGDARDGEGHGVLRARDQA